MKSEINKAAHYLAQIYQVRIRYALEAKCRALLKDGKTREEITRYLVQLAVDGGKGLDELMEHVSNAPGLTEQYARTCARARQDKSVRRYSLK